MKTEKDVNYILVDSKASWIDKETDNKLMSAEIQKIINFYVLHVPCEDLSARATVLKNTYKLKKEMHLMDSNFFFMAEVWNEMKPVLEDAGLSKNFPPKKYEEKICVYKKDNQLVSVFSHIRNSLAHGRFNIIDSNNETFFILEDFKSEVDRGKGYRVSARMILKKSTLLKWIEAIEGGEKAYVEEHGAGVKP